MRPRFLIGSTRETKKEKTTGNLKKIDTKEKERREEEDRIKERI